jgi:hypothetical protein
MKFVIDQDQILLLKSQWESSFKQAIQEGVEESKNLTWQQFLDASIKVVSQGMQLGVEQAQAQFDSQFPNGLEDYLENHYVIANIIEEEVGIIQRYINRYGSGELWSIAKDITDAFTKEYKDKSWEGNYYDTLQDFVTAHFKNLLEQ